VLYVKAKKQATDYRLHGAEQDVCDKKGRRNNSLAERTV
jgi:hypothetical protein